MPSSPSDPNQTVDESAAPSGGEDPGSGRERAAAVHELRRDPSPLALAALAGSLFTQERTVIQQADAYTEMLTADVPLSAYTDNGFAAHLQGGMMRTSASARDR